MTTYFCPGCWATVPSEAHRCEACGADIDRLDAEPIAAKLVRALHHPEPQTAVRAAALLGLARRESAVPVLLARQRETSDPYLAAEIATALGLIGTAPARAALRPMRYHPSVIVRAAAERALAGDRPPEARRPT